MSKETLRVAFIDFWPEWKDEDFISPILNEKYDLIIDNNNPDVVFHSIFGGMREVQKYKCKKILILGENHRPERFNSNYSISFDPNSKTNYRLPLWQMYLLLNPDFQDRLINKKKHDNFEQFASFTVSNPSNQLRNNHFDQLNSYKKVSAYGKVRTTSFTLQNYSKGKYWRDAKDEFFLSHPHKFMMAYENTAYPYYCTEKIMDAFLVGSIPLYWGDPKIAEDWNLNAFLNIPKLGSTWLEAIKIVDTDKSVFEDMYNAPVFKDEQLGKHIENIYEFKNWLIKIVKT